MYAFILSIYQAPESYMAMPTPAIWFRTILRQILDPFHLPCTASEWFCSTQTRLMPDKDKLEGPWQC